MTVVLMDIVILRTEQLRQLVQDAPALINQLKPPTLFAPVRRVALRVRAQFLISNAILLTTFRHVHVLLGIQEVTARCVSGLFWSFYVYDLMKLYFIVTSDPCSPQTCLQNGVCSSSGGTYTCACAAGFYGEQCQCMIHLERSLLNKTFRLW